MLACVVFFFNDTATTEIYTLSLHDALPISDPDARDGGRAALRRWAGSAAVAFPRAGARHRGDHGRRCSADRGRDRKSTRLNSSHANISYAVFCLKKKNIKAVVFLQRILATN